MKRTLPLMGLAIVLCGLAQPLANIPERPHASAQTKIVQTVAKSQQNPVEAPVAAPEPQPVVQPTPAPEPAVEAPVTPQAPISDDADKMYVYMHESGNRTDAINPDSGACGLGQALPCSKMGCSLQDYACQDAFFTNYAMSRYGSWANAAAFWRSHSWW